MKRDDAAAALRDLHARVDRRASELAVHHSQRLHCARGCHACCVDDLTVFTIEADRIRASHAALLRGGTPHPAGACAFLGGEGECRIYPDRPYVCRTQGLPLRWLDEDDAGAVRELRDICPLNLDGPALESLPEDVCWSIGPVERELGEIQDAQDDARVKRIALRSLFERSG